MSDIKFRPLEADEIEVRVGTAKDSGVSLLLYKDARCDMRLLDDVVGAENWECEYQEIHGALYCTVRVYDSASGRWVSKQDCGVPSNMEGVKGEASDAFKRACFRWGIGRELYTAPFIWVASGNCKITKNKQGKPTCYDRFSVTEIVTEDGRIAGLTVKNDSLNKICWSNLNKPLEAVTETSMAEFREVANDKALNQLKGCISEFADLCEKSESEVISALLGQKILKGATVEIEGWTPQQAKDAICQLQVWIGKKRDEMEDIPF